MGRIYLAADAMAAVVILVLLYANIFELKLQTKKKKIFSWLLVSNEVVVVADAVSWGAFNWKEMQLLLFVLVAVTYILPFFILACFSHYLYVHLSEKAETSEKPFKTVSCCAMAACVVFSLLAVLGKLYEIRDGKYYPGPASDYYYLFYIASLLLFLAVIVVNGKKLGIHDAIATLIFCLSPLVSIFISMIEPDVNIAVPFMAIDVLVIYVLLQSERENKLLYQSNNDELTGLYNRRAYEEDMARGLDAQREDDLVYASIDINGLKVVNDTLGHAAGDELISGAAYCMKRAFGAYGRVYRIGGDEFAAIFFADEERLRFLMHDLDEVTGAWRGSLVPELSVSAGYTAKREFPEASNDDLAKISDQRMYKAKESYYANKGIDRRGQAAAHTALCNMYSKILKINLTKDSYSVMSMPEDERTEEKGFEDTISAWLYNFGASGQVYGEDLAAYHRQTDINYLKKYFGGGKKSINIFYRRKYGEAFMSTSMEMILADDYSPENQSLFLYVRNLDA